MVSSELDVITVLAVVPIAMSPELLKGIFLSKSWAT
jgi:hypothetical protein